MTDRSSGPMVFGDIHELLREVNGESEPVYSWKSQRNSEDLREENKQETRKNDAREDTKHETKDEAKFDAKLEARSDAKLDARSDAKFEAKNGVQKKPESSKRPVGKRKSSSEIPQSQFLNQVASFDQSRQPGKRHMVFIPDDIFNALQLAYGDRNISAVYAVLARNHISKNKEEMRRIISDRSNLLTE